MDPPPPPSSPSQASCTTISSSLSSGGECFTALGLHASDVALLIGSYQQLRNAESAKEEPAPPPPPPPPKQLHRQAFAACGSLADLCTVARDLDEALTVAPLEIPCKPEQWQPLLLASLEAIRSASEELFMMVGDSVAKSALLAQAKGLAEHVTDMCGFAMASGSETSHKVTTLEPARAVVAAVISVVSLLDTLRDDAAPTADQLVALATEHHRLAAVVAVVDALATGRGLVEGSSIDLVSQFVKYLQVLSDELVDVVSKAGDGMYTAHISHAIELGDITSRMACALFVPACKAHVAEALKRLRDDVAQHTQAVIITLGEDNPLATALQDMSCAIDMLGEVLECVEAPGCEKGSIGSSVRNLEELHTKLDLAFAQLRQFAGHDKDRQDDAVQTIMETVKSIESVAQHLAVAARDDATRESLLAPIRAMAEALQAFDAARKESAQAPEERKKHRRLNEKADTFQAAARAVICSINCFASGVKLRYFSKELVAHCLNLATAIKGNARMIPPASWDEVEHQLTLLAKNSDCILQAIQCSLRDPVSLAANYKLMQHVKHGCGQPLTLITTMRKAFAKIDEETKQPIVMPCEAVKVWVQMLVRECSVYKAVTGQAAVEQATMDITKSLKLFEEFEDAVQYDICQDTDCCNNTHALEDAASMLQMSVDAVKAAAQELLAHSAENQRQLRGKALAASQASADVVNATRALLQCASDRQKRMKLIIAAKGITQGMRSLLISCLECVVLPSAEAKVAKGNHFTQVMNSAVAVTLETGTFLSSPLSLSLS
eukprot:TRINITY_DN2154_c0_g1_i7.p1 TRINITY_DN2154_c0_g1~~TRINITY_DN2154_c0_g1_i7.p1  ORF type:complete len:780 (-),score=202.07 TRINITY_DN2154_c0_g1_i7:675-3014(-)